MLAFQLGKPLSQLLYLGLVHIVCEYTSLGRSWGVC
jgi:hypothetical protein